jgi:hypothetical protein
VYARRPFRGGHGVLGQHQRGFPEQVEKSLFTSGPLEGKSQDFGERYSAKGAFCPPQEVVDPRPYLFGGLRSFFKDASTLLKKLNKS